MEAGKHVRGAMGAAQAAKATPQTACAVRVEMVAENRHGEIVRRRLKLEPDLPAFVRLLADLRRCGYRGVILRKVGR